MGKAVHPNRAWGSHLSWISNAWRTAHTKVADSTSAHTKVTDSDATHTNA